MPESETAKINIDILNEQIGKAHSLGTDTFHVYSVRHKFTNTLKKKPRSHCWATPLTSTWLATGEVVACVDLRDEDYNTLCNYFTDGLAKVREVWGSEYHRNIIKTINERLDRCKRCTNGGYNDLIEKAFIDDGFDMRLI